MRAAQSGAGFLMVSSTVVIGSVVYDVLALAFLHVVRPEVDPVRQAMSNYVLGPYGFLMTIVMLSAVLIMASMATGLRCAVASPIPPGLRLIPVLVAGTGWLVMAIVPKSSALTDGVDTVQDRVHGIAGMMATAWVVAVMFIYAYRFSRHPRWRSLAKLSLVLAWVALVAMLAGPITRKLNWSIGGVTQRLNIAAILLWAFAIALRMRSLARSDAEVA